MHHKPLSLLDLSENALIWGYLGNFWGGIALEIGIRVIGQLLEKDRVQIRTLGFPAVLKEVITIWIWIAIRKLLAHGPGPEGQDPSVYQIVSFK